MVPPSIPIKTQRPSTAIEAKYKKQDFQEEVRKITEGRGVDVILDFIGASYWEKNLASIAVDGRWVLIGMPSTPRPSVIFRTSS